ncbi:MAG: PAS domain S-box protein, partial [Smithellaceae bacterium]
EKYRNILENIQDGYFELDLAGNYTFANDAECRNIGYPREELIGMNNRQFQDEKTTQKMHQLFRELYRTGKPVKALDVEIIRKNGMKGFNEISASLIMDAEGKPIGFRGISRDITERKRAEDALRESEEKYRSMIETIQDGYFEVDLSGKFTFVNDAQCRIVGTPREQLLGMSNMAYTSKEEAKRLYQLFSGIYKTGEPVKGFAFEYKKNDGTMAFNEISASLIRNSKGEPMGFRGIARDVTERKRAEEERKQSFERLRKALGATVQAISMTVEMKDPYTSGHQRRVSDLARSIATEMGLSADRRDFIRTASSIHDIGKIAIPSEILSKPTKLTDLEFSLIKTHSQSGYDIMKDIEFPWSVADVVLQHHERIDGSGYPQGLKGDDILLEARILAIADVVEAIASHRPYRPAFGIDIALKEISDNKGTLYDADAVDACLKLFREKSYQLP